MVKHRVLVFGLHDQLGGLENYMHNIVNFMDQVPVHFDFAVSFPEMAYESEYRSQGIKTYHLASFKRHPLTYYSQILTILREERYDSVYYNMMSAANIIPLIAAKRAGVKQIVAHAHNNGIPHGVFRRFLNSVCRNKVRKYATELWSNSCSSAEWMFGSSEGVTIIQNAVDAQSLRFNEETRRRVRLELGVEDNFLVGNVARFAEQKNHKFLIEVFNALKAIRPESKLVLVGRGELEEQIRKQVDSFRLSDDVLFLGERTDIQDLLQAMDVFILPSLFDGLPLSALEAQASGLFCVTSTEIPSEVCILPDSIQLDLNQSPNEWATEISRVHENRKELSNMVLDSVYDIRNQAPSIACRFCI